MPIEERGGAELIIKFGKWDALARLMIRWAMGQSVNTTQSDAENYPPESEANQPPPPYYIRGIGTQYQKYNRRESKQLSTGWIHSIAEESDQTVGRVENRKVTYAPWVHSVARQTWFHKLRGWRNVDKILEDNKRRIVAFFESAMRYASGRMN